VKASISTIFPLLSTVLNAKKCWFWCRIFCSSDGLDDRLIEKLKQFDGIPIRSAYFVDGFFGTAFREKVPGICPVFESFDNFLNLNSASEIAAPDCAKKFGFEWKVNLKSGPNFKATLPLIGSSRA
jgi:hypothetical protein